MIDGLLLLERHPDLLYGGVVLFALAVGSFLNVVISRLPRMLDHAWRRECADLLGRKETTPREPRLSLAHPPSHCRHCGHRIRALENLPLLSYLVLRGRCAACGEAIGPRYPLVEAVAALLSVLVVQRFGVGWESVAALLLTWCLITLAAIDLETGSLPDAITLPVLWLGLMLSLTHWFTDSRSAILGAALGYLGLWGLFHLFRLLTGKEAMGFGDFKLFAMLGAWLGWQYLPQILLLATCAGVLVGGALILVRKWDPRRPIPFGPFLATAGWIGLLWGDAINHGYLRWVGLA
ncbi:MAG: A24 family peptidase [Candidatus Thiosymbion ectosymbiont of Robbea hypermnestra]|nr:A24 family peptidase [Candidatus Thiosymbion ectosymbiont of Robbea hypermnestra]